MSAFGGKRQRKLEPNRDFPTAAEVARLLAAAKDNPKSRTLLLTLALLDCVRASFALRWSDIDLKAPVACLAPRKELGPRWNGVDPPEL
jgi:integrase